MPKQPLLENLKHVERLLEEHGDSTMGVGWPRGAEARYQVMLDIVRPHVAPVSLLDFGCGAGHLLEFIRAQGLEGIEYVGLDALPRAVALCREKFPGVVFLEGDVLAENGPRLPAVDYVVMNGVLTYKGAAENSAMFEYACNLLEAVFPQARIGVAFNVLSKQVDWEQDDLFHLDMDRLVGFLARRISRHFVIRADYGLYEYTVHVFRDPVPGSVVDTRRVVGGGGPKIS